ncbi:MAG TPA: FMN-binding protein [Candidatus Limnocylindrales bacterium]
MDEMQSLGSRAGLAIASLLLCAGLVLGFKAPDDGTVAAAGDGSSTSTGTNGSATGGTSPTAGTGSATGSASGTTAPANGTETVTGSLISTRYGPVQVQVTITNRKITAISAVALPSGGRSGMISQYAAPILTNEALSAQSANIDLVSGATYTSTAYEKSLQAALDKAGI